MDYLASVIFQPSRSLRLGARYQYKQKYDVTTQRARLYCGIEKEHGAVNSGGCHLPVAKLRNDGQ